MEEEESKEESSPRNVKMSFSLPVLLVVVIIAVIAVAIIYIFFSTPYLLITPEDVIVPSGRLETTTLNEYIVSLENRTEKEIDTLEAILRYYVECNSNFIDSEKYAIAVITKNLEYCEGLVSDESDSYPLDSAYCMDRVYAFKAFDSNDISYCEIMKNSKDREVCRTIVLGTASDCDGSTILNPDDKIKCKAWIPGGNINLCNGIGDDGLGRDCRVFHHLINAIRGKDPSICESIRSEERESTCTDSRITFVSSEGEEYGITFCSYAAIRSDPYSYCRDMVAVGLDNTITDREEGCRSDFNNLCDTLDVDLKSECLTILDAAVKEYFS